MKNWAEDLEPIIKKYGKQKHPLDYNNRYQLLVMIILSAQTTDSLINKIAPEFFKSFPSFAELKIHTPEDLYPLLSSVRGFRKKAKWIIDIARIVEGIPESSPTIRIVGDDSGIPSTIEELTKLPGIGRKSANIVIRESGDKAEGVIVDLHVLRVAPRLGIATDSKPDKIEKQIMEAIPQEKWNEIGMTLSFHGREICRPDPKCEICVVNPVCNYYRTVVSRKSEAEASK